MYLFGIFYISVKVNYNIIDFSQFKNHRTLFKIVEKLLALRYIMI
jgi:hypothetical protein